jgi:2-polyprenyl-3-methyl-5-hydroxy-6-metoxy-1,4-benzoquinol methylase
MSSATADITATTADITATVNAFYERLPFNLTQSPGVAAQLIRKGNPIQRTYPALDRLLANPMHRDVLEVGCGIGWFANSVAFHYGARVEAVDLCRAALDVAREVSRELGTGTGVTFRDGNLFELAAAGVPRDRLFPVVNSLGVLHHTPDCQAALRSVAAHVGSGGYLHLGLYHRYGREPFLELFDDVRRCPQDHARRQEAEEAAFARYRALYPATVTDEAMLRSWFHDQVLHPHETQHTVEEIHAWLSALGLEAVATSVNEFRPVKDWRAIYELERTFGELSYRRNVIEKRYYPGFFIILARRRGASQ